MKKDVREIVRDGYAKVARQGTPCCGPSSPCCGGKVTTQVISRDIGYSDEEMGSVPEGANLGLGCGNPVALASLREGETVLDLGSGAGFDCFLAAARVGKTGHVIGVDMTPEMLEKARANAGRGDFDHVEFRLGEIENLPVADAAVDVVISNCVINLSPDKRRVFRETFRVLKSGGRLMISDLVLLRELPEIVRNSEQAYVGCLAGAILKEEYIQAVKDAGFTDIRVIEETVYPLQFIISEPALQEMLGKGLPADEMKTLQPSVVSIKLEGRKGPENGLLRAPA